MNNIPFLVKSDFPLDSNVLQNMQDTYKAIGATMAKLIGGDAIISGCEVSDTEISDGIICVNDEILPFKKSVKKTFIRIITEVQKVTTTEGTYEVLHNRYTIADDAVSDVKIFDLPRVTYISTLDGKADKKLWYNTMEELVVSNSKVEIREKEMRCISDQMATVKMRGYLRLVRDPALIAISGWYTLFKLQETNLSADLWYHMMPSYPIDVNEIIFTGCRQVGSGIETFHFRITDNGFFQIFAKDGNLWSSPNAAVPIYINLVTMFF